MASFRIKHLVAALLGWLDWLPVGNPLAGDKLKWLRALARWTVRETIASCTRND